MFSHLYIEKKALEYPMTRKILKSFPNSVRITIDHYKDFFCRPDQDYTAQKSSQKLILAVKEDRFLYRVPEICIDNDRENLQNSEIYYSSAVINCIYNCEYCFLQGMYPSANIVVFVNIDDFFGAAENKINESKENHIKLKVSYDSDIIALENIVPYAYEWIRFAKRNRRATVEIRTKSGNFNSISMLDPPENIDLAWTLSPQSVAEEFENGAPSLESRISSVRQAVDKGWKVRLCFDPVIMVKNWKDIYSEFIDYIFTQLPYGEIHDISTGAFRMPFEYFKKIKKIRPDSGLYYTKLENRSGNIRYPEKSEFEMLDHIGNCINKYKR